MANLFSAMILFYISYLLQTTVALPAATLPRRSTSNTHFDLGPLDSCVLPTEQELANCSSYVTYPVPASLLSDSLLRIKHKRILGLWERAKNLEMAAGTTSKAIPCANSVLEKQCKIEFPQCMTPGTTINASTVEFTSSPTCMDKICSIPELEPDCTANATVPLATCYPVTELSDISRCNELAGWSSTYITKWMHVRLQEIEQDIDDFYGSLAGGYAQYCTPLYAELRCGTVGRCSEQGTRTEMNATREACEALMSCVSVNTRSSLLEIIDCSHYPSLLNKASTPATPITVPTTQPPTTDKPPATTSRPTPPTITEPSRHPSVLFPDVPSKLTSGSRSSCVSQFVTLITLGLLITYNLVVL